MKPSMREPKSDVKHIDDDGYINDDRDPVEYSMASKPSRREIPAYVANLSPEERLIAEKKLVRKIDVRLIPTIIIMYIMNYLDRNNIAAARLGGLEADLKLKGTEYQTAVSILFVGYVLMQVPSNLFLNKIGKPAIYLPTAMVIWGIVSGSTAAAQSFRGLVAVRFFLGFVEVCASRATGDSQIQFLIIQ